MAGKLSCFGFRHEANAEQISQLIALQLSPRAEPTSGSVDSSYPRCGLIWVRNSQMALAGRSHRRTTAPMTIQNLQQQAPFTTKDGSTIRSILDRTNAPVENQSLAEATLPAGFQTQRHYHRLSEEIYFVLEGSGTMAVNGEQRAVLSGDAVLIPAGAWHTITAIEALRFLCCCAPPYSHEDTYFE